LNPLPRDLAPSHWHNTIGHRQNAPPYKKPKLLVQTGPQPRPILPHVPLPFNPRPSPRPHWKPTSRPHVHRPDKSGIFRLSAAMPRLQSFANFHNHTSVHAINCLTLKLTAPSLPAPLAPLPPTQTDCPNEITKTVRFLFSFLDPPASFPCPPPCRPAPAPASLFPSAKIAFRPAGPRPFLQTNAPQLCSPNQIRAPTFAHGEALLSLQRRPASFMLLFTLPSRTTL